MMCAYNTVENMHPKNLTLGLLLNMTSNTVGQQIQLLLSIRFVYYRESVIEINGLYNILIFV